MPTGASRPDASNSPRSPSPGDATALLAFEWDADGSAGVIVNMSVWADIESLETFVYGEMHRAVLRRRREWFGFPV